MQFTAAIAAVAGFLTLAAAAPAPAATPSPSQITSVSPEEVQSALQGGNGTKFSVDTVPAGTDTGVYFCTNANYTGSCWHIIAPPSTCLAAGPEMNDLISSVGPDSGFGCTFYVDNTCNDADGSFATNYPGISDLSQYDGGIYNDQISSWQCYAATS